MAGLEGLPLQPSQAADINDVLELPVDHST